MGDHPGENCEIGRDGWNISKYSVALSCLDILLDGDSVRAFLEESLDATFERLDVVFCDANSSQGAVQ